jgi:hypothetical protein
MNFVNAYMVFIIVKKTAIMAENPKLRGNKLSKKFKDKWEELSEYDKKIYHDIALAYNSLYPYEINENCIGS